MRRSQASTQLERLESLMGEMDVLTRNINRLDRDDMRLSLIEAKAHIAKAQGWIADEIVCMKIDWKIPFDLEQEGNTDVA